jgi:RNA polymerase sigma factor (sigma-70 family)
MVSLSTHPAGDDENDDPESGERFWERAHQRIFRYIQAKVQNRSIAEDLTQDTLASVLRNGETFARKDDNHKAACLNVTAKNKVTDHYRKASTQRELPLDDVHATHESQSAATMDLFTALDRLDARSRCVVLWKNDGYTHEHIGKRLGITPQRSQAIYREALQKLSVLLGEYNG